MTIFSARWCESVLIIVYGGCGVSAVAVFSAMEVPILLCSNGI